MYRTAAPRPADDVPAEIEYAIETPDRLDTWTLVYFGVPALLCVALALLTSWDVSVVWTALAALLMFVWWRRRRAGLVLRGDDGGLGGFSRGPKASKGARR